LARLPADLLDRYPAQISGGQRQRVSLMRALMLDPDVLLFDEPLGALDPMIRSQLQTELQGLFRSLGKTVVFVTHDLHEAAFFADDMVLLRQGRIEQSGTPRSFIEHPANGFVKEFLSAQQNHLLLSNLTS
jgi:osmoprotectant transport system ATP-binding protein